MRRELAVAFALAVAACARPVPPAPAPTIAAAGPGMCRVGPDGGPVLADRGIGGTGGPERLADRGIGGTGIIAVITGFASVCLAGQEVGLPPDATVTIEGRPASANALRAGQVAIVEAAGTGAGLAARRIATRTEVSGPVEAASGDRLRVAGQDVLVRPATWGDRPAVGAWTTVSGLRRPDGVIEATRLDPRPPGDVVVHGRLRADGGKLHVGGLEVRPAPGIAALAGQDVTATGTIAAGSLAPASVVPDLLATNPAALFGAGVGVFFVEGFATVGEGRVRFGQGFAAEAGGLGPPGPGRAVLRLERGERGLRAVGTAGGEGRFGPAPSAGRQFEPAPMPNRAVPAPAGSVGRAGPEGRGEPGQNRRGGFGPGGVGPAGVGPGSFGRDGGQAPGRDGPSGGPR